MPEIKTTNPTDSEHSDPITFDQFIDGSIIDQLASNPDPLNVLDRPYCCCTPIVVLLLLYLLEGSVTRMVL